jgi:protein-L-isoaspartate(D-aspartate) O-methyltransferase
VIVTAAPDLIPPPLIYQLKPGGRMVAPVGLPDSQHLIVADKDAEGRLTTQQLMGVRFSALDDPEQPALRPS